MCGVATVDAVGARNDQSPLIAKDLDFLRSDPFRKQKQVIESSGVQTRGEAKVLESAVADVLRFCGGLALWQHQGNRDTVLSGATERGAAMLQWPPKYGANKIVPLSPMQYSNWRIVSNSQISVRVDFGDMGPDGLLQRPPIASWRMIFLKVDGKWKFDRYEG